VSENYATFVHLAYRIHERVVNRGKYMIGRVSKYYPRYDEEIPILEKETTLEILEYLMPKNTSMISGNPLKVSFKGNWFAVNRSTIPEPPVGVDPKIDYFLKVNPNWDKGDELACLAYITQEDLNNLNKKYDHLMKREGK
jgi:hypothetical protein